MTWWDNAPGTLNIYEFHVDWETPLDSTFTGPTAIPTADWIIPCGFAPCVPQLDSAELLDTLSDRLMNRMAYRNFGTHESLVTNFTVGTAGGETGIRWFELRNPEAGPSSTRQGPTPPIPISGGWPPSPRTARATWRSATASLRARFILRSRSRDDSRAIRSATMGGEDIFLEGTGSQINTSNRWGDYSSMSVDPVGRLHVLVHARVLREHGGLRLQDARRSFKFPGCTAGPTGTLEGTVTDGTNPIEGASR